MYAHSPFAEGDRPEIRGRVGEGYAGQVAETGKVLNIPFDGCDRSSLEVAQKVDLHSGDRIYSLLCVPILNPDGELIGVTQLLNKKQPGTEVESVSIPGKDIPNCFQTSFDETDQRYMQLFNNQVGIILQNAELLAAVKQQEQNLRTNLEVN